MAVRKKPVDLLAQRQRQARWLFTRYRKLFYGDKLRGKILLEVVPGKLPCGSWAETEYAGEKAVLVRVGEANWTKAPTENDSFLKSTLIHELAHCYLGPGVDHMDPAWKDEALRLGRLGALLETL